MSPLSNATTLANYASGIGTQGATLEIDSNNKRVGIGTTNPQGPEGSLQVGTAVTISGNSGIVSATTFHGDFGSSTSVAGNLSVSGVITYEDVTNIDSVGIVTARSDLSIADKIIHTGDTNTAIRFPAADTITAETAGSERLRIDSSGNIGIGNADPGALLHVSSSNNGVIRTGGDNAGTTGFEINYSNSSFTTTTLKTNYRATNANATLRIDTGTFVVATGPSNGEKLRVDAAGRLLVGASTSRSIGAGAAYPARLQVESSGFTNTSFTQNSNDLYGPEINLGKSRGTSAGGTTVVQSGDQLGIIQFAGADGTDLETNAAAIECRVDGTPGSNDMPGRISFLTTADGASNPTERMRIDSSGRMGIATQSPTHLLSITGTANNVNSEIRITAASIASGYIGANSNGLNLGTDTAGIVFKTGVTGGGSVGGTGTERMRIDSSGRMGLGVIPEAWHLNTNVLRIGAGGALHSQTTNRITELTTNIYSDGSNNRYIHTDFAAQYYQYLGAHVWSRAASGTAGNVATMQESMRIDANGRLGVGNANPSALATGRLVVGQGTGSETITIFSSATTNGNIHFADGTTGANRYRGYISYLHTDNSMSFGTNDVERMRIDNSGGIFVGNSSATFNFIANTNSAAALHLSGGGGGSANIDLHGSTHSSDAKTITFDTNSIERMRINSSGQILMNCTSQIGGGYVQHLKMNSGTGGIAIQNYGSSNTAVVFRNSANNASVGAITTSNVSTSYIESSDYRLKENVVDITDGITRVKQLQPRRFNFIADADTTVDGFIAHEAQAVVPQAVTGTKDEVDDEGNAVIQGIDKSKLVPLLTAALQEAIAKIETLEAKVAALEG